MLIIVIRDTGQSQQTLPN